MMTDAAALRFWSKVRKVGECFEWTASVDSGGYGQFMLNRKNRRAHRLAWEETHGPVPRGLHVLHRCDNRRCVRWEHLFLGTNADNVRDMDAKGRRRTVAHRGEQHANARLSQGDVIAIRELHANGRTYENLAEWFGVSRATIGAVVTRRNWGWL
jgi:hypothetical protein